MRCGRARAKPLPNRGLFLRLTLGLGRTWYPSRFCPRLVHRIRLCWSTINTTTCHLPMQEILHLHSAIRSALDAFADGARGLAADGRGTRELETLVERHRFLRAVSGLSKVLLPQCHHLFCMPLLWDLDSQAVALWLHTIPMRLSTAGLLVSLGLRGGGAAASCTAAVPRQGNGPAPQPADVWR
jgi:hypothetical protein